MRVPITQSAPPSIAASPHHLTKGTECGIVGFLLFSTCLYGLYEGTRRNPVHPRTGYFDRTSTPQEGGAVRVGEPATLL